MEGKTTPCECPMVGFCQRHGINKSPHLHKLCQNHIGYFNMWESCRGPNQNPSNCIKKSENYENNFTPETSVADPQREKKLPSTMSMAKNFIKSATNHIKNGMKNVAEDRQKERLAICAECPYIIDNGSRCGKCGCFLQTKTKWESSSCPIGKW